MSNELNKKSKEVKVNSIDEALDLMKQGKVKQLDFDSKGNLKKAYSERVDER